MRLGFHVSVAGGLKKAVERALHRRCQTMQIFTAAPSRWERRPVDSTEDAWFVQARHTYDLRPLFVHAPYLLNLATADEELWSRSRDVLVKEIQIANRWEAAGVIFHPGSTGGGPVAAGLERVARAITQVREETDGPARIIIENSAGQGNVIGDTMDQLGRIVRVTGPERLSMCLDTAHAFAAGYDLRSQSGLDEMLSEADEAFGLDMVSVIHLNGSRSELGSHVDRHDHIGRGQIGREGMKVILTHPQLRDLPFIMETPKDDQSALEDDLTNLRRVRRILPSEIRPPLPPQFKDTGFDASTSTQ